MEPEPRAEPQTKPPEREPREACLCPCAEIVALRFTVEHLKAESRDLRQRLSERTRR